ncbi:MAG: hypothetical protein QXO57_03975 [Candidatus Aenigmatarchaeota archaeon]|nr:hypothetical protein [Candidatus Aenigmarchaeota archaeon]
MPNRYVIALIPIGILAISIFVYSKITSQELPGEEMEIKKFVESNLNKKYQPKKFYFSKSDGSQIFSNWTVKWDDKYPQLIAGKFTDFMPNITQIFVAVQLPQIELNNETARALHKEFFQTTGDKWECQTFPNTTIIINCRSYSSQKEDIVFNFEIDNQKFTFVQVLKFVR